MKSAGRTMDVAAVRLAIARLPELLCRLGDWWLKEFLGLFPERVAEFLAGRRLTMVALTIEEEGVTLELLGRDFETIGAASVSRIESVAEEIETFLRTHSLERKTVQIGLRLPAKKVFSRQLLVPAEAAHAIDSIVAQDLARKTPFKAEDVLCDFAIVGRIGSGKIKVSQWIARREDVRNALAPLKMPIEDLAFITFGRLSVSEAGPVIRLQRSADAGSTWYRKAMLAACLGGLLLAIAGCGLKYWNQQASLDRLDAEIRTTGKKAQQVRGLVDQLQEKKVALLRFRIQRNEVPRLIDIWDEVTKILPAHSWLTEFRVAEGAGGREMQVNLSGFSIAAPSLVGIVDRSPMFVDAALSAPVALDPTEGRERFALRAKVRRPDFVKGEAR